MNLRDASLIAVLLTACGGSATPVPTLPGPDPTCGAHGVSVQGQCFCGGGYTGPTCAVPPPPASGNTTCINGQFFCDGAELKMCGQSGHTADAAVAQDCSTEAVKTSCGPCASGVVACQSATPSCAGTVYGFSNPVTFSDAGCETGVSCALSRVQGAPTDPVVGSFVSTIQGLGNVSWQVNDMGLVSSGVSFPLNPSGAIPFQMSVANTGPGAPKVGCRAPVDGATAPRPGSVRLTYASTAPGSALTFDLEGPISCGVDGWKDVTVHLTTVWQ